MSLLESTATNLLARLDSGETTSVDVTRAYLEEIERWDPLVRAFLRSDGEAALKQAADIDRRRREGKPVGRLGGLPVAVKDLLCAKGELTTCGSRMLANFRPPYDSTVVAKLRAADAAFIGRTNLD